jgi:hypothetical protein
LISVGSGLDAARDQVRRPGVGMLDDQDVGAVGAADRLRREHRPGRAGRHHLARGQHVDAVAEQRGQAQVVQRREHGDAEPGDDLEDLNLVMDVEVVGRLVQDEMVGFLGQRPGDQNELLLAAGQGVEPAPGQLLAAHALDRQLDDVAVGVGVAVEGFLVRRPADHHHLPDGEIELAGGFLRDHRDAPRRVLGAQRQHVGAVQQDPPGGRRVYPVDRPQDRRFPAAVRPHQPGEFAVADGQVDPGDDAPPGDVDGQVLQPQAHWVAPYR